MKHYGQLRKCVVHSLDTYLRSSENWIYPQVSRLKNYASIVLANSLVNTDQFPPGQAKIRLRYGLWTRIPRFARYLRRREQRGLWVPYGVNLAKRAGLLHSHFGPQGVRDRFLAGRAGVAHCVSFYGADLSAFSRQAKWLDAYRELFKQARAFVVEGPYMANTLKELGCPESKIHIRPHGVDTSAFKFVRRNPKPDGSIGVLIAGRFVEKKGIDTALLAVAKAAEEVEGLYVTLVGGPERGEASQHARGIQELLASPTLSKRSKSIPFMPLREFISLACEHDIFVQASRHAADGDAEGGYPVVLLQLAATGMPIVATRHCDIPEIVIDFSSSLPPGRQARQQAA
jgi:colanic acid/amylovoran biosynthesis glycosyltransferase